MLSNYKITKILGEGTFSTVKLAINKETGEEIAIKILEKNKIKNNKDLKRIEREINMVKNISHPNIAKVFDIKEDEQKYYFLMEFCENGELFNYIIGKRKLSEEESAYFYYQIINGLEYIHLNNIIHRDLKPENLLLTKNNILKIIDFGLSSYNTNDNLLSTPCGSPCYASPEKVSGQKYNGFTSDVWSTGIILYAMIYGYLPFENLNNNYDLLFNKITECKVDYPRNSSFYALDLLKKILVPDPNERIKICDIKKHKFYLKGKLIYNHKNKEIIYNYIQTKIGNCSEKKSSTKNNSVEKKDNNNKKITSEKNNNTNKKENLESVKKHNNDYTIRVVNNEDANRKINRISLFNNKKFNKIIKKNSKKQLNENLNTNISNKKEFNSLQKNPLKDNKQKISNIEETYFSQLNIKSHKRNKYCKTLNNSELKNNFYNINSNNQRKNNLTFAPPLQLEKMKNYDSSKFEEEKKNDSKYIYTRIDNNNKNIHLTNKLPRQNTTINKIKKMKIEVIPTYQTKISESNNIKKKEFINKLPDFNSNSSENNKSYISKPLSNLKKITPLNYNNKKNIKIYLQNNNLSNYLINGKTVNYEIISNKQNTDIFVTDINYINRRETEFNKKIKNEKDKDSNMNNYKRIKTYYIPKKKDIENKNNSLVKNISQTKNINVKNNKQLKQIEEEKNDSKCCEDINNNTRYKIIRNRRLNDYLNTNYKINEKEPKTFINFNPNNSFLINSPPSYRKDIDLEFLRKNRTNKRKYSKKNNPNPKNYSFNTDIKQNEKLNYYINNKPKNKNIENTKNNNTLIDKNINEKGKQINNNHLVRNSDEISSELKNNCFWSNNYMMKHINNKSLEDNDIRNKKNSKNKVKEKENSGKINIINHRNGEINRIIHINNKSNHNYIKIISRRKSDLNSKKYKKKCSSSFEAGLQPNSPNLNNNKTIKHRRINKEKEEEKEIDNNKKKENLKLNINKIYNNKISDNFIHKVNYLSNAHISTNINNGRLKYDNNEENYDLYNTERIDNLNSNTYETYPYSDRNVNDKYLSNKSLFIKNQNTSCKSKLINDNKIAIEYYNNKKNRIKDNNEEIKKNKLQNNNNIISNVSKIKMNIFPSITIDMNVLNKNNTKYLKFYDSIKNKL